MHANILLTFQIISCFQDLTVCQLSQSCDFIYQYMNNYNSPLYYRSNPYADHDYLPPGAHKNRIKPGFGSKIPQGAEFFEHAMKKHYGYSYGTEIQHDHLMESPEPPSSLQSEAMQKSYFRSLNNKDIQGATTNTLISKAVRNKMKAQQELSRRKQEERIMASQSRVKEAEQKLYNLYHSPKQNNHENFHKINNYYDQGLSQNNSKKRQPQQSNNYYRSPQNDISERARQQIKQSYMRQTEQPSTPSAQYNYQPLRKEQAGITNYHMRHKNGSQAQYAFQPSEKIESQRMREYQAIESQRKQQKNREQFDKYYSVKPVLHDYDKYTSQTNSGKQQNYDRKYPSQQNYRTNHMPPENYQQYTVQQQNFQPYNNSNYNPQINSVNKQNNQSSKRMKSQQHRAMNPTYLSYGSPSFSVASRNVIGNF